MKDVEIHIEAISLNIAPNPIAVDTGDKNIARDSVGWKQIYTGYNVDALILIKEVEFMRISVEITKTDNVSMFNLDAIVKTIKKKLSAKKAILLNGESRVEI